MAELDEEEQEGDAVPEGRPWTAVLEPPVSPHSPTRPLHVSSHVKKEPSWTMSGRGEEKLIEYTLPLPDAKNLVRARLMKSRPIPENCQEPDNFMTHQIEYIVGGSGAEWVKLNEAKRTVRQKMGWIPVGHDGEPYFLVPYKVLEQKGAGDSSPGQYGATPLSVTRHVQSTTTILQARSSRWPTTYERRPQMPEPATYSPSSIRMSKSSPSFGFGSAPRMPTVRREQGPEPGAYKPRNCWDGSQISFTKGRRKREKFDPELGLEPTGYDSLRGLSITRPREPTWRLDTSGGRSKVVDTCMPAEVGPGTYNAEFKLVQARSRVMQYSQNTGFSRKPEMPPDTPFTNSSIFAE